MSSSVSSSFSLVFVVAVVVLLVCFFFFLADISQEECYLLRIIIRFLLFVFSFCSSFCSYSLCSFCLSPLVFLLLFPLYGFSVVFPVHRQIGWALLVEYFDVHLQSGGKDDARKLKPFTNDSFMFYRHV